MKTTLYKKSKKGKILSWSIWSDGEKIITEYGEIDGKKQIAEEEAETKNVGRSNETTPEEQAASQVLSKVAKKKLAHKYYETIQEAEQEEPLMPMLAKEYDAKKPYIFPATVQYKFDGVRCLAYMQDREVILQSRGNKEYSVPVIKEQLKEFFEKNPDTILDGEIYIHGEEFNTITSLVKKTKPGSEHLCYHVYDIVEDEPWLIRKLHLADLDFGKNLNLVKVLGEVVLSKEDIETEFTKALDLGYEGLILRLNSGKYLKGNRSAELLKIKSFVDEDFEIVGYTHGVGKAKKSVIWTCITKDGNKFNVVPKGSIESREEALRTADSNIGRKLKVKYFNKSEDGIPRFPVGLGIKLEEDI